MPRLDSESNDLVDVIASQRQVSIRRLRDKPPTRSQMARKIEDIIPAVNAQAEYLTKALQVLADLEQHPLLQPMTRWQRFRWLWKG